ncbi:MAG: hypothetical protein MI924_06295 [Chloroflexales bacterium]|nr:hypothetical protein [Chloroflexales bacterium]
MARDIIFGFAFLQSTRAQCEQSLRYLDVLLNDLPEDNLLREEAEAYRLASGRRKGRPLGSMRPQPWRRLRLLVQRDRDRMDQIDTLRKIAQDFLRFMPPNFPGKQSGVLSFERRRDLEDTCRQALHDYSTLPTDDETTEGWLTAHERQRFQALQRRVYAATNPPRDVTLQWDRADGAIKSRDIALLSDLRARRYLFLAHILHAESRHCRPMPIRGELVEVNNPDISFAGRQKPSIANLYALAFAAHQRRLLDRARREADRWKGAGKCSGAVRSAKLQAHYDQQRDSWWVDVMLAIGLKPERYLQPEHLVGVHINPHCGWFIGVCTLVGTVVETLQLDELQIARLLENQSPVEQARRNPTHRTAKEHAHRLADAIVALCRTYNAICAFENIGYRSANPSPQRRTPQPDNSRTVFPLLEYKLPLAELFTPLDIRGVAPKRDCGACGSRYAQAVVEAGAFHCPQCQHSEAV